MIGIIVGLLFVTILGSVTGRLGDRANSGPTGGPGDTALRETVPYIMAS